MACVTSVHVKHTVKQLDGAVVRVDDAPAVVKAGHVVADGDKQRGRVRQKERNAAQHKRAALLHHACGACARFGGSILTAFHLAGTQRETGICNNGLATSPRHAELAPQILGGQGVQEAERGPPTQPLLTPSAPQIKFLNH
jgi:hypothetical protein